MPQEQIIIDMRSALLSAGDLYSGGFNVVDSVASDWIDYGFDADSANEWIEAGFWDPGTAARCRDAGCSGSEIQQAAHRLIHLGGNYTDDCPIYSACNSDTDSQVLIDEAKK